MATYRCWRQTSFPAVRLNFGDEVVKVFHSPDYANWQTYGQVPIDISPKETRAGYTPSMSILFRDALIWHITRYKTPIADLSRGAGVSVDIINKLKARDGSSTNVETALSIATFYGKTLEQFMACEDVADEAAFSGLVSRLTPDEKRLLLAQLRGILTDRAGK